MGSSIGTEILRIAIGKKGDFGSNTPRPFAMTSKRRMFSSGELQASQ
ncbi:hypothetical protein [Paraglaciecola arctica]|nr:hypothetical protein [Paraglaciecola arctica]